MNDLPVGPEPGAKRSNSGLIVWVVVVGGALLLLGWLFHFPWG